MPTWKGYESPLRSKGSRRDDRMPRLRRNANDADGFGGAFPDVGGCGRPADPARLIVRRRGGVARFPVADVAAGCR